MGKDGPLDGKWKPPSAIAYERDLYQQPDIPDPIESQSLELRFFQKIDDRAAIALLKLDKSEKGGAEDRIALSQFMISLLHRSPSRLKAIRAELADQTVGAPYQGLQGEQFEKVLKSTTNKLLASLVESREGTSIISRFRAFKIDTSRASTKLLTSDRPINVSNQLISSDAFMIMPYAPDRLLILTHQDAIAGAFSSQNPDILVRGMNQAVVEQSEDIVIASNKRATKMVDRLFLRSQSQSVKDPIGLIRRKSPLIQLTPMIKEISRHEKKAMKYRGI
ncbi:hypothetical protein AZE99_08665 [Sphingorhabdus sp. M41]|nr:hypothetical protein AZE99_08665 [Sphingorhabdus sp. M41]